MKFKLNLGLIKVAFYNNGGIVMIIRTGFNKIDYNAYCLKQGVN